MPIPTCVWAQRKDKVRLLYIDAIWAGMIADLSQMAASLAQLFVTIDLQDVRDAKTNLDNADGTGKLTFSGKVNDTSYDLDLALMKEIDVAGSQVRGCCKKETCTT